MDENERYVRERWDKAYEPIVQRGLMGIDIWVEGSRTYRFHADNLPAAWQAAYDFTKAREEAIRQVEEEIHEHTALSNCGQWEPWMTRILGRLQVIKQELQRGMKATR